MSGPALQPAAAPMRARLMSVRQMRPFRLVALLFFAAAALLPLFGSTFYMRMAIEALLLGMLALGVDILLGYAGLLSLGQAAFFGFGAYASSLFLLHVTQSIWLAFAGPPRTRPALCATIRS